MESKERLLRDIRNTVCDINALLDPKTPLSIEAIQTLALFTNQVNNYAQRLQGVTGMQDE